MPARLLLIVVFLIRSSEFQELRQQQSAADLLAAFYKGLFDREPDTPD